MRQPVRTSSLQPFHKTRLFTRAWSKFRGICQDRPVAAAVAALYAYEAQVPEISTTKIEGLKTFYGTDRPEALAYFAVHEEADKAHRAAWRGWLEQYANAGEDEILATAHEALDTLWGALDAVQSFPN
jgi:pyrroloquinoline-quinone synthase